MTSRNEVTDAEVVRFIKRFTAENGYPPTVREVCEAIGDVAPSTGHARVTRMIREGALRNRPGSPRSLTITPKGMVLIGGTAEL